MAAWFRVAERSEVRPGCGRPVDVDGRRLALFNLENRILAVDDRCPGDGRPLSQGRQAGDGRVVECPQDGCRVDLVSGRCLTDESAAVRTYPVRIQGNAVEVRF